MLEYDFRHDDDNFLQIMIKMIENLMACRCCMNHTFHSCMSAVKQFKTKYPNEAIFTYMNRCNHNSKQMMPYQQHNA